MTSTASETTADAVPDVLSLRDVSLVRDGRVILGAVDWTVRPGERWVVLGRNGSGKTSLIRIASLYLHPSTGTVQVLGQTLGRTDVRRLRTRIGLASPSLADQFRGDLTPTEIVMTALHAALEPWWHVYTDADRARARDLLGQMGCSDLVDQRFALLSSGERQRVLLARTLMTEPGLLLLDEPTAGLDLRGREELVATLGSLADDPGTPATILVTHHVEEIPDGFTHALLLTSGRVQAIGPLDEVLTADGLSSCFGLPLELTRAGGRWSARAVPSQSARRASNAGRERSIASPSNFSRTDPPNDPP
jgi:iron complex transport system ATP-binding protein